MESVTNTAIVAIVIVALTTTISGFFILKAAYERNKTILDMEKKELAFQKTINQIQLNAIEEERIKIGSLLHDDLGQVLTLAWMQVQRLKTNTALLGKGNDNFEALETLINKASEKCSDLSTMLYPATLLRLGLFDGLHELILQIEQTSSLKIQYLYDYVELGPEETKNLFRIFQELLNNTLKHAKAQKVQLIIKPFPEKIEFKYTDDGIGIDANSFIEGLGTHTIKARIEMLKGAVANSNLKGNGFEFKFHIPLNN
jgi:signal transduction histidine kinase